MKTPVPSSFLDPVWRHSVSQFLSLVIYTNVRFVESSKIYRVARRIAVKKKKRKKKNDRPRYQQLTHPLIPRQTIVAGLLSRRERRPRQMYVDRIVSRSFTLPSAVSQFVDPFISTWIRFGTRFGQYTVIKSYRVLFIKKKKKENPLCVN